MKLLLIFLLWLAAANAFAIETKPCIPDAEIQKIFNSYNFQHWDAGQKTWLRDTKVSNCDHESILAKTVRTIFFINQFPKLTVSKERPASVVISEGAGSYLQKRISTFLIEDETRSSNCKANGSVAYVRTDENNTMHLCPYFANVYGSDLMSTYVLVHEARHTEGFAHAGCLHGPYEKFDRNTKEISRSCDATYEEQGSYGVGTGFLLNVYHGTSNEMLREEARANIVQDLITRFNKLPLDMKAGALLHKKDGAVTFFDGIKETSKLAPKTRVMTLAEQWPTFFTEGGSVKSYKYSKELSETRGGYARSYRELRTHEERESLLDVFYGESMSCLLDTKRISCVRLDDQGNQTVANISFQSIRPLKILPVENLDGEDQLFLVDEKAYLYELPPISAGFTSLTEKDLHRSEHPAPFISTGYVAGISYGLNLNGDLYSYNLKRQKWQTVAPLKQQKIKKILAPFYWSPQLQDL